MNASNAALPSELHYLTDEFIRAEVGRYGAILTEADVEAIRAKTIALFEAGQFHHTGVYWIANQLAAERQVCSTRLEP